jgi:sigma-B regulation protein RsbU (phosphoserine phosphatase)
VTADTELASALRGEIANILAGAFFLFICLTSFVIAWIRPGRSSRLLVWVGVWSGMYGAQELLRSYLLVECLPLAFQPARQPLLVLFSYLIIVAATLAFLELTSGALHRFLQICLVASVGIAAAAILRFAVSGSADSLLVYNQVLVALLLAALVISLSIPALSRRFLVVAQHRVLTIGTLLFAALALFVNIVRPFQISVPRIYNTLGFATFLLSISYTGLEILVSEERRLLLLDDELAIARQLQLSILPEGVPAIAGLDIAAVYQPMSAVAGDFYEFLVTDEHHVGFLVADVSGHGVPAALIASMIKVAAQAANEQAGDPEQMLRSVGSVLSQNARGQLASAAYLWIDTRSATAEYAAAGHPPLLHWHKNQALARIQSNGLLFGVPLESEYPVRRIPLMPGDRFLLYTDGLIEAENSTGEQFGERRLEEVLRDNPRRPVGELSQRLTAEIQAWQPSSVAQQDDITLILIEVLEPLDATGNRGSPLHTAAWR